jgi:glycine oxidase
MLSPLAELDNSSLEVARLGWRSIPLWQAHAAALGRPELVQVHGSWLVAHRSDAGAAQRVLARLSAAAPEMPQAQPKSAQELTTLEPAVHGLAHAWWLPGEGQVDTVEILRALQAQASAVQWHWGQRVQAVQPGELVLAGQGASLKTEGFDWAIDVRGVGAKPQLPVRGVRGEVVWLHAPQHGLTRPVRLLHPRHRVYLVPRSADLLMVGASEIESEDRSPVSLRSVVELLSAAHSVMPALAEARVLRLDTNLRPALPDNEPLTEVLPGLLRINGLFRHGWLLAPAVVQDALELVLD